MKSYLHNIEEFDKYSYSLFWTTICFIFKDIFKIFYILVCFGTKQQITIQIFSENFKHSEQLHDSLGIFKYVVADRTAYKDNLTEIIGEDYFYIGEASYDNFPNGIGVKIHRNGTIQEGYWNNGNEANGYNLIQISIHFQF